MQQMAVAHHHYNQHQNLCIMATHKLEKRNALIRMGFGSEELQSTEVGR
jgi:hypothetical protein